MLRNKKSLKSQCLSVLILGACHSLSMAADLSISDEYVRAMPPVIKNTTAYLNLTNHSSGDRTLIGAQSPIAKIVELHTHIREDDMLKMRSVESIRIPAGQTTELKPGGDHIMLIGLHEDLNRRDSIPITLIFQNGEEIEREVPVKSLRGSR